MPEPFHKDAEGNDLGWHALNYRTAHTVHAEVMWKALERYVREYGEKCAQAAREEAAKLIMDRFAYTGGHGEPPRPSAAELAEAIKNRQLVPREWTVLYPTADGKLEYPTHAPRCNLNTYWLRNRGCNCFGTGREAMWR